MTPASRVSHPASRSADIIVAGAGPVGLTLAMDLARRGARVVVVEPRAAGAPPSVKCNHVAARSMELFRRLGLAAEIRAAGLPDDFPHDVAFRTSFTGREITRIPIPSPAGRRGGDPGPDTGWPTPEPPHRINQIYLEPILFARAGETPGVEILSRVALETVAQDDAGVVATARDLESGAEVRLEGQYLVGCDGGRSTVRRQIGARLVGDAVVQRVQSTYLRAPGLLALQPGAPAWGNISLSPRRSGTVYAIDGRETWLLHNYLRDDEPGFDSVDRDWAIREILGVGPEVEYAVISREDWYGRRLVANRFRDRRVFICGDAAHLWVPYAGYGMNAGLADAENLAWLLAARLAGWGAPAILDAHERERLPITEQVSRFAMDHAHAMARQRKAVPPEVEADGPAGEAARAALGRATYDLNVQQYAASGLNFGYYYDDSPLVAYDGAAHPAYSMGQFEPSTVPGCRTPHVWLADGRSLYDAHGDGYALLRLDAALDPTALLDAAAERGLPLRLVDLDPAEAGAVYTTRLLLSRPDRHVAWRGDALPADAAGLVDRLRGAG